MMLKAEGIHFYTTNSEVKASIVERFNRTLKSRMRRYFTWKNTLKYIDVLPQLVKSYNHSYHRSIGMKPAEVNGRNESIVWKRLYTYTTYILPWSYIPYYSRCLQSFCLLKPLYTNGQFQANMDNTPKKMKSISQLSVQVIANICK